MTKPPCVWRTFDDEDIGIPCGANARDAWYQANLSPWNRRSGAQRGNLTQFQRFVTDLQKPGGFELLPQTPQRLHHPVKGQLSGVVLNALTLREAGGV